MINIFKWSIENIMKNDMSILEKSLKIVSWLIDICTFHLSIAMETDKHLTGIWRQRGKNEN